MKDAAAVARCWKDALELWGINVMLSPPEPWRKGGASHWSGEEPLAYTDLEKRQVVVNYPLLDRMGAMDSLTGVLAHEVGHHARFPHTLSEAAALQVLEQDLIPGLGSSLTNLFYDLLVNEVVGRTRKGELCAVYRGFLGGKQQVSPLFFFYLSIYEELWDKEPGTLVPGAMMGPMEERFPGCRADARMFAQTFYALDTVYKQFVYFCSRVIRYIDKPQELPRDESPFGSDLPEPDVDDVDSVLRGHGQEEADEAMREARQRGWLKDSGLKEGAAERGDPLGTLDKFVRRLPGTRQAEFREALVSKHYRRLVDRHVLKLPPEKTAPEPVVPSVLEEWEWGDSPRSIDWTASVLAQGPLAGVRPLRRDLLPDDPSPREQDFPAVEVYLDTSGSMPDPARALNVMTLAAQILAASALRKKGKVRAVVYSAGPPLVSGWLQDEETARRFLLKYAGGGTEYPFDLLLKFAREEPDVVRVVISDSDFLYNFRNEKGAKAMLEEAVERSRLVVAFLAAAESDVRAALKPVLAHPRFRLTLVHGLDQFARAATDLAQALFPDR